MGKCVLDGCDEWVNSFTNKFCCILHKTYHERHMARTEARQWRDAAIEYSRDNRKASCENEELRRCLQAQIEGCARLEKILRRVLNAWDKTVDQNPHDQSIYTEARDALRGF